MERIEQLLANNRAWADRIAAERPDFFPRLAAQQAPGFLWIGCADSRVPANQIVGVLPGELFVHRNVANVVVHTDLNCLAVIQFAVEVLRVGHVIVCGHYGCGGVEAAVRGEPLGLIDNWLRHIQDVADRHAGLLDAIPELPERLRRLCELNVIEQAVHVCRTTIVRDAWRRGQPLAVHAWIYGLTDGRLRDLNLRVTGPDQLAEAHQRAVQALTPG